MVYYCDKCAYETSYNHNLKKHIQAYHIEGFSYSCDKCTFKTVWEIAFTFHKESHAFTSHKAKKSHEDVKYSCKQCDFKGLSKRSIKDHVEAEHEGITLPCNTCTYTTAY